MLDYKLLEALAMVIQEGGFDRAARSLHLTQSAVSQRVRQLEEQVGQILVARTTPPKATPPGKKMLKHFLQVQRLEQDLTAAVTPDAGGRFTTLAVGINADSLATWFLEAIHPLLTSEGLLLDIRTDDQDQTLRMLRNGEVVGCISTQAAPVQGCRSERLGRMRYGLFAAPAFAARWFPRGITPATVSTAPAIIFNRQDALHQRLFETAFGQGPGAIPTHFIPSSEKFAQCIAMGLGYGMLPTEQSAPLVARGALIDLLPRHKVPVDLYWQCWNIGSQLLEKLTRRLVRGADDLLAGAGSPPL